MAQKNITDKIDHYRFILKTNDQTINDLRYETDHTVDAFMMTMDDLSEQLSDLSNNFSRVIVKMNDVRFSRSQLPINHGETELTIDEEYIFDLISYGLNGGLVQLKIMMDHMNDLRRYASKLSRVISNVSREYKLLSIETNDLMPNEKKEQSNG